MHPSNYRLFQEICDYKEIIDENRRLILFHYPIWSWNGMHYGAIHLHGHIHQKTVNPTNMETIEDIYHFHKSIRINISVEQLNYKPMTIGEIMQLHQPTPIRREETLC
jgi:calcineurin-like phosphoesterase family protein